MKRRTVLASTGTITTTVAVAGCISISRDPWTVDVVVNSCLDDDEKDGNVDKQATIQIRHAGTGNTIFDETVTVPAMSCSDVVDGVRREDVFLEAGTYTVAVTVDEYGQSESQVEFSEREINDNSDNVLITIREDEIEIV